jgi:hypothetical protein
MGWFRKFIIRLIVKEIETNGIIIGNKRIWNNNGAITISEV